MRQLLVLIAGILFGAGLVVSGMTDPARVIGFLDLFGDWDPALAFVMGGAVATFAAGRALLRRREARGPVSGVRLPDTSADPVCRRMVIGSAIFGIGWGLGGLCPGPAVANLARLSPGVWAFVALMLAGMVVAQRCFGLDE